MSRIERETREARQFRKMEAVKLPEDFDYDAVHGLSNELRERLKALRPTSLGQASRAPGMTPAALSALMVSLRIRGESGGPTGAPPAAYESEG